MRTQDEIVARIEERKKEDLLGFEISEYLAYLDYEHAKPYLKEGVTEKEWKECATLKTPREEILEYLPFAWEKANGERGISAERSVMHIIAWLWLDKSDILEKVEKMYEDEYCDYGKAILQFVGDHLGYVKKEGE